MLKAGINYLFLCRSNQEWTEVKGKTWSRGTNSRLPFILAQTRAIRGALYLLFICSMRYFDRAGLFAEACQEFGFLSPEEEKNSILAKLS